VNIARKPAAGLNRHVMRVLPLLLVGLALPVLEGCALAPFVTGPGGELTLASRAPEGGELSGAFDTAMYSFDNPNNITIVMIDGDPDSPRMVVTARMLWRPRAGRTPIDPNATNTTVRYIVFSGDEQVGIYGGAGYLFPGRVPGGEGLSASIWHADLRLTDRTAGFADLLGPSLLTGKLTVRRDDDGVSTTLRKIDQALLKRLSYPALALPPAPADSPEIMRWAQGETTSIE